jgi:predicted membrane channel-forming protein YqfA (hemolysin III family)
MNKFKEAANAFIAWIISWIPIILVISVFTICAMMVGNLIGKAIWIVFVADLVFFYLLWVLLDTGRKRTTTLKKKILVFSILILLLFIAFATLGVSMVTDQRVIGNIFVFLIGCFTVLASYFIRRSKTL